MRDVSGSLHKLNGIAKVSADIPTQMVTVLGTAAPSSIVRAIEDTGRDAILRGSGTANSELLYLSAHNSISSHGSTGAAVCILETFAPGVSDYVRGLIRMVQVAPSLTIIDLSIRGLSPGTYTASIRESGDISSGPASTGGLWEAAQAHKEKRLSRGILGTVEVTKGGVGSVFVDRPIEVWEMIGRSIVVSRRDAAAGGFDKGDPDTLVGVIARSAGVWENDKTVCSCSGKTVWEERQEQQGRGMA